MTEVLRRSGVIDETNEVVALDRIRRRHDRRILLLNQESHVPLQASGRCADFIRREGLAELEILPKESLEAIFVSDIKAYSFPEAVLSASAGLPRRVRPAEQSGWVLVMENVETFGEQKVHEKEMNFQEVERMIPGLVEVAVAWEGCDEGDRARELAEIGVDLWVSDSNLGVFKAVMPGGREAVRQANDARGLRPRGRAAVGRVPRWPGNRRDVDDPTGCLLRGGPPAAGCHLHLLPRGHERRQHLLLRAERPVSRTVGCASTSSMMFRGPVPSDLAYLLTSGRSCPTSTPGQTSSACCAQFYDAVHGEDAAATATTPLSRSCRSSR